MKLAILIFLSVLFIPISINAELDENCQVKNKYYGTCLYLDECNHYFDKIKNLKSLGLELEELFETLREVNCGYVGLNALICCPRDDLVNVNQDGVSQPHESGSDYHGSLPQSKNPGSSVISGNFQTTIGPTTESNFSSGFTNPPTTQSHENETSIETITSVVPKNTTKDAAMGVINNEKFKILPEECGRVLTFKYIRGNRTEFDDFPWTTLVEYETPTGTKIGCGGSLIHSRYVMTAAHCATGLPSFWKINSVRFGEYDTDTDIDCLPDGLNMTICNTQPVDIAVEEVIVHPGFRSNDPSRLHDIALLRLSAHVNFTNVVKPICLPTQIPFPQIFYTSGWGKDLDKAFIRSGTNLKYMSNINLVDQTTCKKLYAENSVKISQSHICGGDKSGQKPCIGDAGGPLMGLEEIPSLEKRVVAFGVLSSNKPPIGDCQSGYPSIYTKVLDYMNWILANLRE